MLSGLSVPVAIMDLHPLSAIIHTGKEIRQIALRGDGIDIRERAILVASQHVMAERMARTNAGWVEKDMVSVAGRRGTGTWNNF
jgi:hypothetical protein